MKTECPVCGGTGQVGFFQGVSRFLLSWDECPRCCGTGQVDADETAGKKGTEGLKKKRTRRKKKKI